MASLVKDPQDIHALLVVFHSQRQAKDFHDRFVVVDGNSCVHIGASINGAGKTAFMISKVEDQVNRDALLKQIEASWAGAVQLV